MAIANSPPVTLEEFLKLEAAAPAGVTLELIDGTVREKHLTTRSSWHSFVQWRLTQTLGAWIDAHPDIPAFAGVGEVRCEITRTPPQIVGIDLGIWIGPEYAQVPENPAHPQSPPALAVEVLSPSDVHQDVIDKLKLYLDAGVREVWIVDAELRIMSAHHAEGEPSLYRSSDRYSGGSLFPGLSFQVRQIFERGPISK